MKYSFTWDLESIYPEGSSSPLLSQDIRMCEQRVNALVDTWETCDIQEFITEFQDIQLLLSEIESFILCLCAQDTTDSQAEVLNANFQSLDSKNDTVSALLNTRLYTLDESTFQALLSKKENEWISFNLQERREKGKKLHAPEFEKVLSDLSVDGYHGWGQMYDALIGSINVNIGDTRYSFGQAENLLSDPSRDVRQEAFSAISSAFDEKKTLFAQTLNHLAGYRSAFFSAKGYAHIIDEALENNRMQHETLAAMWSVIEQHLPDITQFLERKAALLGVEKLAWYDLEAPLSKGTSTHVAYEDAIGSILDAFKKELPKLATFAEHTFENGWIEVENRPGKRPGGFCTGFPDRHESRIFMTYSGTQANVFTLAHEIGHAFHNFVTHPLPEMAQKFRMNVAETASVFAENVVIHANLENASDPQEKIKLLDDQLTRAITFLLNIRARYLFEVAFYEERKNGYVSELRLSELMENAQKTAFNNTLSSYHPYFWAAKLHFFFSHVSFYNFPYTFGFLFSNGIYEMRNDFENFEEMYIHLLEETGCMSVESLAKKHLGVDLTKSTFWEQALSPVLRNISLFCELTKEQCSTV